MPIGDFPQSFFAEFRTEKIRMSSLMPTEFLASVEIQLIFVWSAKWVP